jgi:hypothetical protein
MANGGRLSLESELAFKARIVALCTGLRSVDRMRLHSIPALQFQNSTQGKQTNHALPFQYTFTLTVAP